MSHERTLYNGLQCIGSHTTVANQATKESQLNRGVLLSKALPFKRIPVNDGRPRLILKLTQEFIFSRQQSGGPSKRSRRTAVQRIKSRHKAPYTPTLRARIRRIIEPLEASMIRPALQR